MSTSQITNKKFNRFHFFKNTFLLLFIFGGFSLFGQEKEVKKPEYVFIVNNEIISREKLEDYGEQSLVKSMNKGVPQEYRDELAEKFGNKIGDREFIIKIDLLTEKERLERLAQTNSSEIDKTKNLEDALKLNINDFAKDFTVEMVNGEKIKLSNLKGKVVLINYWATWCAPCLMEFSEIPEKILEPFGDKDFVFIPIAIGENKEKVQNKLNKMKKYGVNFNAGFDPDKKIWDLYATGAIPKNFIIDQNGIIKYISIGNSDGNVEKLALEIKKLLSK
jgi:peroxiredoxin